MSPSSSQQSAPRANPSVLSHLEGLLRAKAEEIQVAGQLGASLLQQQAELEARIGEIVVESNNAETDSDGEKDVGEETKRKLQALEQDLKSWDEGNSALYASVSTPDFAPRLHPAASNGALSSITNTRGANQDSGDMNGADPLKGAAPSTAAGSRRARNNAQHRTNDIELATEIGQSLLAEVRRLQALLTEKDELLTQAESDKDAAERAIETADLARKSVEETVEKYKEENWNLELASQELRASLTDAQSLSSKAELDRTRLTKDLASAKDTIETQKVASDALVVQLEAAKQRHETEMATMRKQNAGLQREKSDVTGERDELRTQLATKNRGIPRVVSDRSGLAGDADEDEEKLLSGDDNDEDDDVFRAGGRRKTGEGFPAPPSPSDLFSETGGDDSPLNSPVQRPGGMTEIETLRASLAHAQRTITVLKNRKNRGEEVESPRSVRESTPPLRTPVRSVRGSARGGRRGRGAGPSRLGRQVGSLDSDEDVEEELVDSFGDDGNGGGSLFDHQFPRDDDLASEHGTDFDSPLRRREESEHSDEERERAASPGPTSLAGIAGLINGRPASIGSFNGSFKHGRSFSALSGSPISMRCSIDEERDQTPPPAAAPPVVWAEASTMTEPLEPVIVMVSAPAPVLPPKPEVAHVGVQASPVVPSTADFAGQTVGITTKESGISTEPVAMPPMSNVGVATDSTPAPPAGVEMHVQTEPLPEPAAVHTALPLPLPLPIALATSSAPYLSPASMEDRALDRHASLSDLTPQASPSLSHEAKNGGLLRDGHDSDAESVATDRAAETETDGEFEDARESIGAASPAPLSITPAGSFNDFHSIRSGRTHQSFRTADDSDTDGSAVEELRTPRYKSKAGIRASPKAPKVVEMGVQTDAIKVEPIKDVNATPMVSKVALPSTKRDSINTFGRPDSSEVASAGAIAGLGGLFGVAAAGLNWADRPLSPEEEDLRPNSVVSMLSQHTDDVASIPPQSALDKGKSLVAPSPAVLRPSPSMASMPPPPARINTRVKTGSPRKSAASTASSASLRVSAPPRPTSPPPADLLYRAQSPAFDQQYERRSTLLVPGSARSQQAPTLSSGRMTLTGFGGRQQNLRPQPSTASDFASTSGARAKSGARRSQHNATGSAASVSNMSMRSDASRRQSMASSRTSDGDYDDPVGNFSSSTDPAVIHAISQTMIGDFLHKYTRKAIGKGHSEKRHKRFFWMHPYTNTLFWSSTDPGAQGTHQSRNKSVTIESIREIIDPNPFPPGLHQGSLIIRTTDREMKLTASSRERHDMWLTAIKWLINRPEATPAESPSATSQSAFSHRQQRSEPDFSPSSQRGMYNLTTASEPRLTPRGGKLSTKASMSSQKRPGTAAAEYERHTMFGSPQSLKAFSNNMGGDESLEIVNRNEIPDHEDLTDDGFEGLENVRVCCGKHDVGSLSRKAHHHHHHQHRNSGSEFSEPPSPVRARSKSSLGTVSSAFRTRTPTPGAGASRKSTASSVYTQSTPLAPLANGSVSRKAPPSNR